jgi:heat shock protein HtpX
MTFRDLIAANKRQSAILVVVFILFIACLALLLALGALAYLHPGALRRIDWIEAAEVGGLGALVAVLFSVFAYYQGDDMVLAVSGAKPIQHEDDPELFNVVEEMSIAAGIPQPRIYLINDPAPNAFATGRDPQHASVAITTGLRTKLNREELQGVMAHEMSHVRNFDIRLMLLLTVLVGTVAMLCDLFWQLLRFSGGSSRSSSSSSDQKGGGGGVITLVLFIIAIILALIAPLIAQLIQLAVSRQREFLADATAVELTRNPLGLASALRKIEEDPHDLQSANRGTAHLYIVNPVETFAARAHTMFASHPPVEDRIKRLEALVHQKTKDPAPAQPS